MGEQHHAKTFGTAAAFLLRQDAADLFFGTAGKRHRCFFLSLLANITVLYTHPLAFFHQVSVQMLGNGNGAVMPAGATDGNYQLAFSFGAVERQHVIDQISSRVKKPWFPANASHSRAPARPTPSGAAILPHNRGSAGSAHRTASPIRWAAVFKIQTHAVDGQSVAGIPQKQVAHALFELCRGQ